MATPNDERDPARGFSMNAQPAPVQPAGQGLTPYAPGYGARPNAPPPAEPVPAAPVPTSQLPREQQPQFSDARPTTFVPRKGPGLLPTIQTPADGSMSYGEQMGKVGGFIADAARGAVDYAGRVAKTIVSAPGYGFNAPEGAYSMPAGATPTLAQPGTPAAAASVQVNPQDRRMAAGQPAPVGTPGTPQPVQDQPPVSARNSFGNVTGDTAFDNRGAVSPQNMAAAGALDMRSRAETAGVLAQQQLARESADAQASIAPAIAQARETEARMAAERAARTPGPDLRGVAQDEVARLQMTQQTAREQMAERSADATAGRGIQRDQLAETVRNNASQNANAAARLDLERQHQAAQVKTAGATTAHTQAQTEQINQATAAAQQLQASRMRYAEALKSGDAKLIGKAESELRGLQGKWEKDQQDLYDKVQVGTNTDGSPKFQIYSKRTGLAADQQPQAPEQSKGITKDAYDKLPVGASYVHSDGKTYIKR